MQGMWVVHVVLVLCLAQLTCYGWCGPWDERIGFGLYQSCGNRGWFYVCLSSDYLCKWRVHVSVY